MAAGDRKAGISAGGIIVTAGILAIMFWSFWIGLVIVLIGLIAFGGLVQREVVLSRRLGNHRASVARQ